MSIVVTACSSAPTPGVAQCGVPLGLRARQSRAPPVPTPAIPTDSPAPALGRGESATVAVDALELSEAPESVAALAGSLPRNTFVFISEVLQADGATWFQILPSDAVDGIESGWARIQGDGSGQLTRIERGCDAIGTSATMIATMSPGQALACYSHPVDFEAWIVGCNCDIDGGYVDPEWLGTNLVENPSTGRPTSALLVEPGSPVPGDSSDWLFVHLDPAGNYPDPLPFEQDVLITGSFDHPAAASCKAPTDVEVGVPKDLVLFCRTAFAITEIKLGP